MKLMKLNLMKSHPKPMISKHFKSFFFFGMKPERKKEFEISPSSDMLTHFIFINTKSSSRIKKCKDFFIIFC